MAASLTTGDTINFSDLSYQIFIKFLYVLEAAAILVAVYFLIRWMKSRFEKMESTHKNQRTAINLLEKITSGFIIVVGVTLALKTVGLDITLIVSVGLLGLSYGLKDVIKNYVAGILIFFKSPFAIGDTVKIKSYTGKVEKMEFQATTLKTFDNRDVTIYNSDIMIQSIVNYSRYPMRRMDVDIRLGYGSDIEKATHIFDSILGSHQSILKNPKHSIVFKRFGDTGTIIQLRFWVNMPCNMLKIRSEIAMQIQQALDEATLFMPYEKTIQTETDYTLTDARKTKAANFYNQPLFTQPQTPPGQPQVQVELVDADEPSDDEDL